MKTSLIPAAVLTVLAVGAAAAAPDIPEPSTRVVDPGGAPGPDGYRAAIEIALPAGWHTYWRNPGDAGLPPVFDAAASSNLAGLDVSWPAPERWTDGTSTSIVYKDIATLPVRVRPQDPSAPVDLRVSVFFGYCHDICIPATADLAAQFAPDDPADPSAAAIVAAAERRVPVAEPDAGADAPRLAAVTRTGDDPKTAVLRIEVEAADAAFVDLFAEPPEGWYLAVPRRVGTAGDRAVFELPLKGMPRGASPAGAEMRFTLVAPHAAVEAVRRLD